MSQLLLGRIPMLLVILLNTFASSSKTRGMVSTTLYLQGRAVSDQDLLWLRQARAIPPDWSRKRLARQLCEHWDWRDGQG